MTQLLTDLDKAPLVVKIAAVGFTVLAGLGFGLVLRVVQVWIGGGRPDAVAFQRTQAYRDGAKRFADEWERTHAHLRKRQD